MTAATAAELLRTQATPAREWTLDHLIVNLEGPLDDVLVAVSLDLELCHRVLSISTSENMIWAFAATVEAGKLERLKAFTGLCQELVAVVDGHSVVLGPEPCMASELAEEPERWRAQRPEVAFGEIEVRKLYRWYTEVYPD